MNKRQFSQVDAQERIVAFLEKNNEKINGSPQIISIKANLSSNLTDVHTKHQKQESSDGGIMENKKNARTGLNTIAITVRNTIIPYSSILKDNVLYNKVNITNSRLDAARGMTFYDLCKGIYDNALPFKEELIKDYKLAQDAFEKFDTCLSAYKTAHPQRKIASDESKENTAQLNNTISKGMKILSDLDTQMLIFQTPDPTFYNEYLNVRAIVDPPYRKKKIEEGK